MNKANMAQIDADFKDLHEDAVKVYRDVYNGIQQKLKGSGSRGLSGEIAQLEAKDLNQAILKLTDAVKQKAVSDMVACGCKLYLTQAGWTEIQQIAGLPKTELCKVQVDSMLCGAKAGSATSAAAAGAGHTAGRNRNLEELARQYGAVEKVLAGIAGAGAAAVVVSLFVPGWSLPVRIVCLAGAVVAVLSGSGAVYCDIKKKEAVSKFEQVGKPVVPTGQESVQLDSLVRQITDSQYERNLTLYDAWLNDVRNALIKECDKISAISEM